MNRRYAVGLLISLSLWTGCGGESPKGKAVIPLDQVPAVVREAAQKALPGYTLDSARSMKREGRDAFEIKGKNAQGKILEVELTPTGELLAEDD